MANFECFKCSGSGRIVAFSSIANGVCFQCGGSGKLAYQKRTTFTYTDQPGAPIIPESNRSTTKQWDYLASLMNDDSREIKEVLSAAGAVLANQMYVSRQTMSKAIEIAKRMGA